MQLGYSLCEVYSVGFDIVILLFVAYYFFFHFIQADPRFVWNKNLLEELIEAKVNIY